MSKPRPIDESLEPVAGKRYQAPRHKDHAYTTLELRVLFVALANARSAAELSKIIRALCKGLGREPQFSPGEMPGAARDAMLKEYTKRCAALINRRVWKSLTGYEKEDSRRPPDAGLRDKSPLYYGERQLAYRAAKLGATAERFGWLMGRDDSAGVQKFFTLLWNSITTDSLLRATGEPLPALAGEDGEDRLAHKIEEIMEEGTALGARRPAGAHTLSGEEIRTLVSDLQDYLTP